MIGNILILFVSLNAIHLSQQMPANTAHIERLLGTLSGATSSILRGTEECLEQYISDSVLGGQEEDGNERRTESETAMSYRLFEECFRLSMQTGMVQKEYFLDENNQRKSSKEAVQAVTAESVEIEDNEAPTENQKNNFVERLLVKLKALKRLFTTRIASGTKRRFSQQKRVGNTAHNFNGSKKESIGPPFPVGRFGK